MSNHRYILEPYKGMKSRYTCPGCGKHKIFTRYVDTQTGQHIAETVGKCNREVNCTYHYTPKQHFAAIRPLSQNCTKPEFSYIVKKVSATKNPPIFSNILPSKASSFIPVEAFKQSLNNPLQNHFTQFLVNRFGSEITGGLVSRYFIGSSKHWNGATVFWQIDRKGKIRTGKIMLYSTSTGKRSKEEGHSPNWVHRALKLPEFALQQCLFGEHLINQDLIKPVAICESEKTAIIASIYLPRFVWLACGSLTGLNAEKCKVLLGRKVILFPDLKGFEKWQAKAKELSHLTSFTVSDLLERKGSEAEKEKGLDLADYLLRFPVSAFVKEPKNLQSSNIAQLPTSHTTGKEFEGIRIQGVKTKDGRFYDLLFSADGELMKPGEQSETVRNLATFFEKTLQPALFDNAPCWVHSYN